MSMAGTFSVPSDYLSGDDPIFISVFESENPTEIIEDPFSVLKYYYKMPPTDFFFDFDLSNTDLKPGDDVIVAALWDRDYDGGFPNPTRGDRIGIVVNKETYQFTTSLNYGKNIVPPEGYEFRLNKRIYDFNASIHYARDLSDAGSFDTEKAQLIILAIHVEGVSIDISLSGEIELEIDMDYLLGVELLPGTEYDYIGIGDKEDPFCCRNLPVLNALYDQIVVYENNRPPQPIIKGVDHDSNFERTAYLVAILDKNGNGALDRNDEIGYYSRTAIDFDGNNQTIDLPWIGEIILPDWFLGTLHFPTPIERIVRGLNQEEQQGGGTGPYWIGYFAEPN